MIAEIVFIIIGLCRYSGGQRGIRTLERLLTVTHFPGVRLQPLGHLSMPGNWGRYTPLGPPARPTENTAKRTNGTGSAFRKRAAVVVSSAALRLRFGRSSLKTVRWTVLSASRTAP